MTTVTVGAIIDRTYGTDIDDVPDWVRVVWLVVPTRGDGLLDDLIASSNLPGSQIVVVRTAECSVPDGVRRLDDLGPPRNIQRWWNHGIELAAGLGAKYVAVVNDDVTLQPGALTMMRDALDDRDAHLCWADPEHMTGWLWMIRTSSPLLPVDERFAWWYGDTDLSRRARKLGVETGCAAPHIHHTPNHRTGADPELVEQTRRDRKAYREKWEDE